MSEVMSTIEFDSRLSRLEATVEGLAANVGSLAESVRHIAARGMTQWTTIFSGIGILLTLMGAFVYTGVVRPQMWMMEKQADQAEAVEELSRQSAINETNIEWLIKLEDIEIVNERLVK